MEFDFNTWSHNPSSQWLVKLTNDDIYAGCISSVNNEVVEIVELGLRRSFTVQDVEWIRPLIKLTADGWTVVAGFQPEDFTFDTWWQRDGVLLLINFSDRSHFSTQHLIISPGPHPVEIEAPSEAALKSAHIQLHGLLMARRNLHVPPAARMQ